jgi:hypothetical protein
MSSDPIAQSSDAKTRAAPVGTQRPAPTHYAIGMGGYLAIALALTYPVLTDPSSVLISQWPLDTDHVLWLQWWFERAIESPELSLFHTDYIRFPGETNLQLADINVAINLAAYLIAKPVGLIASYNVMLWLSFVASGSLMWVLGLRLSGDSLAGWLAGLVFAGSSYWVSCALNSWAYLVHIWVFPLTFLALERALQGRGDPPYRVRDFAWLGAAVGLVFHVSPYYLLFLSVLCLTLAPVYAQPTRALLRSHRGWLCIAIAATTTLAIVLPRAIPMYDASLEPYAVHSTATQTVLASKALEFVLPIVSRPDRPEGGTFLVVFLGYTVPIVIACGLWRTRRRAAYGWWLASAAAMFLLALGPFWELGSGATFRLPEYWLLQLPGFSFITNHWRWSLPGTFCLAVAFSLALADLFRFAPRRRRGLAAAVGFAFALESVLLFPFPWPRPRWSLPRDPISHLLRDIDSIHTVLDFRRRAKMNQLVHEKRIVGGWLPRVERSSVEATQVLMAGFRKHKADPANYLGGLGIDAVIVDERTAFQIIPVRGVSGTFERVPLRAR